MSRPRKQRRVGERPRGDAPCFLGSTINRRSVALYTRHSSLVAAAGKQSFLVRKSVLPVRKSACCSTPSRLHVWTARRSQSCTQCYALELLQVDALSFLLRVESDGRWHVRKNRKRNQATITLHSALDRWASVCLYMYTLID